MRPVACPFFRDPNRAAATRSGRRRRPLAPVVVPARRSAFTDRTGIRRMVMTEMPAS